MPARNITGNSTITKADLVEKVYQKIGFSKKEASELVDLVFLSLKGVLQKGDNVKISGFGNFIFSSTNFLSRHQTLDLLPPSSVGNGPSPTLVT